MSAVSSLGKFKSTPETYGLLNLVFDGLKCLANRIRKAWANSSCCIAQNAVHSFPVSKGIPWPSDPLDAGLMGNQYDIQLPVGVKLPKSFREYEEANSKKA